MWRIKFMIQQFFKEPLWFKILISSTLLISIIFSSSFISNNVYYQSCSKLAAAIFFCAYAIKFRRSLVTSIILFTSAVICIFLSILAIYKRLTFCTELLEITVLTLHYENRYMLLKSNT